MACFPPRLTFLIRAALGWAIENGRGDEASELSSLSLELPALALYNASFARVVGMDTERMAVRLDESPSRSRELGDRAGVAKVTWGMGTLRMYSDDSESALDDLGNEDVIRLKARATALSLEEAVDFALGGADPS